MIDTKIILFFSLICITLLIIALIFLFFRSKTIYEKIQIIGPFNNLGAIFIAVYFYYMDKPQYIDLALVYAILSFISILGLKKYFELATKKKE
ncbi:MAG: hypothetical protein LBH40_04150 [Alphaproteobacteria bacterium]|jgi:multicomponent Na+:H+ antiporter subunit F|nr:hypothetical protein [Alphaproteobacteria bacterium]